MTGIALAQAHGQVLPADQGSFIEGDDEEPRFDFDDLLGNGNWQALLYNGDAQSHSWQIRFGVEIPEQVGIAAPSSDTTSSDLLAGLGDLGAGTGDVLPSDTGGNGGTLPPPVPAPGDTGGELPPPLPEPVPSEGGDQTPPSPDAGGDLAPPPDTSGELGGNGSGDTGAGGNGTQTGSQAPSGASGGGGGRIVGATSPEGAPVKYRIEHHQVPVYRVEQLPAGGWLPAGARFTRERIDQGQDFITDWQGRLIAPGDGYVIAVLSDRPFPDGFGPAYPVVHIKDGRWAGLELYLGHTTTAVQAGQGFKQGDTLARADQGHVQGGGWVELGERSALGAGVHGQGAAIAGLFDPLPVRVQTGTRTIAVRVPVHITPAPKRKPAGGGHQPAGQRTATSHRTGGVSPHPPGATVRRAPPANPTRPPGRTPAAPPHHPPVPASKRTAPRPAAPARTAGRRARK